jgi:lactate dehydrogenase-like 2-hydroxyacid dehydrogenase
LEKEIGMKIMVITSRKRVETYSDVASLPTDWELIWMGYDMSVDEMLAKAGDADAILVDAITPVPGELIRKMPNLKIIHSEGVGYNAIDIKTARECNIDVCNNKGCNKHAVAEQAILMMLAVTRREVEGHQAVLDGQQINKKTQWSMEGIQELGSMHVGILGMGDIGLETARLCKAFGCKVSYNKRHPYDRKIEEDYGIDYLSAEELLATCDIVSLHLPVSDETYGYMNRERFSLMKNTAILINTARGEIVDNDALLWALKSGEIKAAGLETLAPEPVTIDNTIVAAMKSDSELANKITLSPHIGGLTYQTFTQIYANIWDNFKAVENGQRPKNVVN